jgi:hypothetical protein
VSETSAADGASDGRDLADVGDVDGVDVDGVDVDAVDDVAGRDDAERADLAGGVDGAAPEDDAEAVAEPVPGQAPGSAAGRAPEPSSPQARRALNELAGLADLDLIDQPDAYQRIHLELQDALTSIDDA